MNYEYITGSYLGEDEQQVIREILRPKDAVFYDIGANVGYFSICVAKMVPHCKVIAFEPIPEHYNNFKTHLKINNIGNIILHEVAVAEGETELLFSNFQNSEGNTYKNESLLFKSAKNTLKVKGISVDGFIAQGNPAPTLLKMDVEGAELDVLKGAAQTLLKHKPYIILATHDCHVPGVKEKCLAFLKEMGYTTSVIGAHNKYLPGLDDFFAQPSLHKNS